MPADAVAWALGAHGVILSFSLVGLYRYSDRSSLFTKSLAGTDELLSRMRRYLATAIEDELTPIFDRAESEPQIVLPDVYTESPARPVSSDAFREAIRRFVYSDADILIDYGRVRRARLAWCFWARLLSWSVLGMSVWEFLCVSVLALTASPFSVKIPEFMATWLFVPTALLILTFFSCQAGLLHRHDVIHDNNNRYANL